jgi:hypothetical protein
LLQLFGKDLRGENDIGGSDDNKGDEHKKEGERENFLVNMAELKTMSPHTNAPRYSEGVIP